MKGCPTSVAPKIQYGKLKPNMFIDGIQGSFFVLLLYARQKAKTGKIHTFVSMSKVPFWDSSRHGVKSKVTSSIAKTQHIVIRHSFYLVMTTGIIPGIGTQWRDRKMSHFRKNANMYILLPIFPTQACYSSTCPDIHMKGCVLQPAQV